MGEIELTDSDVGGVVLTPNSIDCDLERATDPVGSPVTTDTLAVTGFANKAAGITAVMSVLLTIVVAKKVSLPFVDHATIL